MQSKLASQGYSLKISTTEHEMPMDMIYDEDNGLHVLLWRGDYVPNDSSFFEPYKNVIFRILPDGTLDDSVTIDIHEDHDLSLRGFRWIGDSLLIWGNAFNINNNTYHLALLWADSEYNILGLTLHGNYLESTEFSHMTLVDSSSMVFAGRTLPYNDYILVKTWSDGVFIHEETIQSIGLTIPNISYLPATNQLIAGGMLYLSFINNSTLSIDTTLTPEFYDQFVGSGYFRSYNGSSCLLPGMVLYYDPPPIWNPTCIRVDTSGQMTDSVIYHLLEENNSGVAVDFIKEDTLFFCLQKNFTTSPSTPIYFYPTDRWIGACKFNFSGDRFWEHYFGGDANYVALDIAASPDGGCAIAGTYYDWRNNGSYESDVIIYKMDSEGLITTIQEVNMILMQVYPNPVKEKIYIKIPYNSVQGLKKIVLQDVFGNLIREVQQMQTLNIIELDGISSGIYFVSAIANDDIIVRKKIIIIGQ